MVQLPDESRLQFKFPSGLRNFSLAMIGIGVVLMSYHIIAPWHSAPLEAGKHAAGDHGHHDPSRLFYSLHLALMVVLPMAACALFFLFFNHLSGAAWSVTIRRIAENYVWYLIFCLVLMALIFFGGFGDVFHHWVHAPADDALVNLKKPWLNAPFFIGRNLIIMVMWIAFGFLLYNLSVSQDSNGDVGKTRQMVRVSAIGGVLFALTFSSSAWDLSMSLEPHWFSTMWAVYIFAGGCLMLYASMILWIWYLKRNGYYGETLNENHIHDLSKFMFGHTVFWGYIAVSQFMLIWYAPIPEETIFYALRGGNSWAEGIPFWAWVSIVLVVLRFFLPFMLLLQREPKRDINYMAKISVLIIVGQIVDMYWVLYPTLTKKFKFDHYVLADLGPVLIAIGAFILIVGMGLSRSSLIPRKDPRLEECLHFHQ